MIRALLAGVLTCALAAVAASTVPTQRASAAAGPTHTLSVSGTGVEMFPAFAAGTRRYGVTTTGSTGGSVTVAAGTSDPDGLVLVDGRPLVGGQTTVTGLSAGDEISVIFEDAGGRSAHSLVYLPAGFPYLQVPTSQPGLSGGKVALTLTRWDNTSTNFETIVDRHGVPVYVRSSSRGSSDLKRQPNGHYSVVRIPGDGSGKKLVELDDAFRPIGSYQTVGLGDTDTHDSVLLPNGHRILLAYRGNAGTGKTDSLVQETTAAGKVVFQFSTAPYASESLVNDPDYAHVNAVDVMDDGDLLVSFRHFSSVFKIARTAHDGFKKGDVVWRLGGRRSDFTFVNDPYPGPCAQHSATELPNGHILMFDNGSGAPCVNPSNPSGPAAGQQVTRIAEYAVNPGTGRARLVWSYLPGFYDIFGGSAQRRSNGNTLVGWSAVRSMIASEVDPAGHVLWSVRDRAGQSSSDPFYSTYRAFLVSAPDAIRPTVRVGVPQQGARFGYGEDVSADFSCTDRGGSTLRRCSGPVLPGERLDTSTPGKHTFTVTAKDGAGKVTKVSRTYVVASPFRADASIRALPGGRWVGVGVHGGSGDQSVRQRLPRDGASVTAKVRVRNDGTAADRFKVKGAEGDRAFRVRYFLGSREVTGAVVGRGLRTGSLAPGESVVLRVKVTRTRAADPGDRRKVSVRAFPVHDKRRDDTVATRVRATR